MTKKIKINVLIVISFGMLMILVKFLAYSADCRSLLYYCLYDDLVNR